MALAAQPLRIAESRPGSPGLSILRFRYALAASRDDGRFRDVPVEWWDGAANVWRPTSILRSDPAVGGRRECAEVQVPDGAATSLLRVRIDHLRLPKRLTAGVARFWIARYRRLLLLALMERAELSIACLAELRSAYERMVASEALGHDVWTTAFRTGIPDAIRPAPVTALSDRVLVASDCQGECESPELGREAMPLLAIDLLRLNGALSEAGVPRPAVCAHPLVATVASLFRSAARAAIEAGGIRPSRTVYES